MTKYTLYAVGILMAVFVLTQAKDIEQSNVKIETREEMDCQCGEGSSVRIVGGQEADPNSYPYHATFLNNGQLRCGGSIISDIHILTAAHCVEGLSSSTITFSLGDHDLSTDSEANNQIVQAKSFTIHENYNAATVKNDIAIIELTAPITFTDTIKTICIPSAKYSYVGAHMIVTGHGTLSSGGSTPDELNEVTVKGVSFPECKSAYGDSAMKRGMLCAAAAGKDSCQGDSGGPLVRKRNTFFEQAGIVSWGIGCADPSYPGVYTNVSKFRSWIASKTTNGKYCTGSTPS